MHACMHACMYVCMRAYVYICMCIYIYIYIYTIAYIYIKLCVWVKGYVCVHMHVYLYIYTCRMLVCRVHARSGFMHKSAKHKKLKSGDQNLPLPITTRRTHPKSQNIHHTGTKAQKRKATRGPKRQVQQPSWGDRAASPGEASAQSVSRQKQR